MESITWTTPTGVAERADTPPATGHLAGPRRVAAIPAPLGGGVRLRPVIGTPHPDPRPGSAVRPVVRLGSADAFAPIPGHAPGGHPA
jgi:hypothetical protein